MKFIGNLSQNKASKLYFQGKTYNYFKINLRIEGKNRNYLKNVVFFFFSQANTKFKNQKKNMYVNFY